MTIATINPTTGETVQNVYPGNRCHRTGNEAIDARPHYAVMASCLPANG
jgi:hypothetical protein